MNSPSLVQSNLRRMLALIIRKCEMYIAANIFNSVEQHFCNEWRFNRRVNSILDVESTIIKLLGSKL
jgi:hypothetical protein